MLPTLVTLGVSVSCMVLCAVSPNPPPLAHKVNLFTRGLVHMALSTDSGVRSKILREPDPDLLKGWKCENKTVILIRHGESMWNEVFNKGKGASRWLGMPHRLATGLAKEAAWALSPASVFIDSKLSKEGIVQAKSVREFLQKPEEAPADEDECLSEEGVSAPHRPDSLTRRAVGLLKGESEHGGSVIASSNLQRAIETATIALWDRISTSGEKIHITSDLQEISRNLDTMASAGRGKLQIPKGLSESVGSDEDDEALKRLFDTTKNRGSKKVFTDPVSRLSSFAKWCYDDSNRDQAVIATGHSLWFKSFFRLYLGRDVQHVSKERKLSNAGVVSFVLQRGEVGGVMLYRIDPDSIRILHGGFK